MKATLEFTLPEEQNEYDDAADGWKYRAAIQGFLGELRRLDKEGTESLSVAVARETLLAECRERGCSPWD